MISTGSPSVNELKPAIIPSKTVQNSTAADQIPQQGVGGRVSTYNTRELQEQLESFAIYDPPLNPSSSTRVPGHLHGTFHPFARFGQILWILKHDVPGGGGGVDIGAGAFKDRGAGGVKEMGVEWAGGRSSKRRGSRHTMQRADFI